MLAGRLRRRKKRGLCWVYTLELAPTLTYTFRQTMFDWDVIVVGSGFGGSVSALRMAQKGYRVLVVEQGRHITPEDMQAAAADAKYLLRMPALGLRKGFFAQEVYRHISLVRGIAVGGGSVVWAAVMLEPKQGFYDDPAWRRLR